MINLMVVADVVGGSWLGGKRPLAGSILRGICFDTRIYQGEDIFVALKGNNDDVPHHLSQLDDKPLKLIIVEQDVALSHPSAYYIKVASIKQALKKMATAAISDFKGHVLAVTGSNGKTTFQTWLQVVLSQKFKVHGPQKSYNNIIGVPVTIMGAAKDTEFLVLEMGANATGEIAVLGAIAKPHAAVLLNVGMAHLGKFGSIKSIYLAKQEIFNNLRMPKLAFVPAADRKITVPEGCKTILFGQKSDRYNCQLTASRGKNGLREYSVVTKEGAMTFHSYLLGNHVTGVLSAIIAVCCQFGLTNDEIASGIGKLSNLPGRLKCLKAVNQSWIIDDSYNANPNSVLNLVNTVAELDYSPKTLVLGDLAELDGAEAVAADFIAQNFPVGIDNLILYGNFADFISRALNAKQPQLASKIIKCKDQAAARRVVAKFFVPSSVVAFKGSRIAKMEHLLSDFLS